MNYLEFNRILKADKSNTISYECILDILKDTKVLKPTASSEEFEDLCVLEICYKSVIVQLRFCKELQVIEAFRVKYTNQEDMDIAKRIESVLHYTFEGDTVDNFMKSTLNGLKSGTVSVEDLNDITVSFMIAYIILDNISLTLPVSTESISSILAIKGIPKSTILRYNMFIRTVLYKLKRFDFIIAVDDLEYDTVDNISKVIDSTNVLIPYADKLYRNVLSVRKELLPNAIPIRKLKDSTNLSANDLEDVQINNITGQQEIESSSEELFKNTFITIYTTNIIKKYYTEDEYYKSVLEDCKSNPTELDYVLNWLTNSLRKLLVECDNKERGE